MYVFKSSNSIILQTITAWAVVVCTLFFCTNDLVARVEKKFFNVQVMSDKEYHSTVNNIFEAIGNVIVTSEDKSLYGEKATMSMNTGDLEIVGNVRYIAPGITIYGTKIFHNLNTKELKIFNAKIISPDYIILGEELVKNSDGTFFGKDAEYTTCKDCPESWSIFGKEIHVTQNEYVRIKHAFIKMKGVVSMYVPYLVFPIKKNRETGLLFPRIKITRDQGIIYRQPWFWAISPSSDLTLSPFVWGDRGFGEDVEYRHMLGERRWFEIKSFFIDDQIYQDNKSTLTSNGDGQSRHLSFYEHQYNWGHDINHHFVMGRASELDTVGDFKDFSNQSLFGAELLNGGFVDVKTSFINTSIEAYQNRNLYVKDTNYFDNFYVQQSPKLSLSTIPFVYINNIVVPFRSISVGVDSDWIAFREKQFQIVNAAYDKNVQRLMISPYFSINWGTLSFINFHSKLRSDYMYYKIQKSEEKYFSRRGEIIESEMNFEISKTYGEAKKERIDKKLIQQIADNDSSKDKLFDSNEQTNSEVRPSLYVDKIGYLPSINQSYISDTVEIENSAYKHVQQFKLKHHEYFSHSPIGSTKFRHQVEDQNIYFDYQDISKNRVHKLKEAEFSTSLPITNVVELQWNNTLIQKSKNSVGPVDVSLPLEKNFKYTQLAYLNFSQGYDMFVESENFKDSLTRLAVETGFSINDTSIKFNEYYFHQTGANIFNSSISQKISMLGTFSLNYWYDQIKEPDENIVSLSTSLIFIPQVTLGIHYKYDIENSKTMERIYDLLYGPPNNCWKLYLRRDIESEEYSINFLINFNNNNFRSIGG